MRFLVLALFFAACSDVPEGTPAGDAPNSAAASSTGHVPVLSNGVVQETMNSAGYTYALVKTDADQVWLAGPETPLTVGQTIVVPSGTRMTDFFATSLNRTFPEILFVDRIGDEPLSADAAECHKPQVVDVAAKVAPAEGGRSVDEIHSLRAELADQEVVVRGQVAKVSTGILGTNWVHIQDGTGHPTTGTHDLLVTSDTVPNVGDVVTVRGPVHLDRDFGAGYQYPVMIEGAQITVE